MANNQHQTNPNQILAAEWQKAAKAILNDNIGFYIYRTRHRDSSAHLNPYFWIDATKGGREAMSEQEHEVQALLCLFIAEYILTDGVPNGN